MHSSIERIVAAQSEGDFFRAADVWLETQFMAPAMENPELAPKLTRLAHANARVWASRDFEVAGAQLEVFPKAGHVINLEAPEEFNRIVHRFLSQRGR